jgi:hypothetical protein
VILDVPGIPAPRLALAPLLVTVHAPPGSPPLLRITLPLLI